MTHKSRMGQIQDTILVNDGGHQLGTVTDPLRTKSDIQVAAFGELLTAELTPQLQFQFPYNINSRQIISLSGNGGSVTNGNDHANVSTGTSSNGFAFITSRDVLKYNAGQGALQRFSALFTTGVADSEQIQGLGAKEDGFFFGYDGADFGVLRRSAGGVEVRSLQITTGSSTAENVTITLNGTAVTDVAVTNNGDVDITAREIATHDYTSVDDGWTATFAGDSVIFVSLSASPLGSTYSLSGAATAEGTFSQTLEGVVPADTWVKQADWNVDGMGANDLNPSKQILDQTKGNVFQIRYQWLGYGAITYSIENSVTGAFQEVHRIRYANANTTPSTSNPTFRFFSSVLNKGNTSNLNLKTSSTGAYIEGKEMGLGVPTSVDNLFTIGSVTSEEPILTLRNKLIYQGKINRVRTTLNFITFNSNLGAPNGNTTFRVYNGGTPENGTSYSDIDTTGSTLEIDTSAVDFNINNAEKVFTFILAATESKILQVKDLRERIHPGGTIMITAQPSNANANNVVGAAINAVELF